jgi:uncharacterized membrane protein
MPHPAASQWHGIVDFNGCRVKFRLGACPASIFVSDVDEPPPVHDREFARIGSPVNPAESNSSSIPSSVKPKRRRVGFGEDFRRFFLRGLAALMPTLITLWLLVWVWDTLWTNVGRHIISAIRLVWLQLSLRGVLPFAQPGYIGRALSDDLFGTRVLGVLLAVVLVYFVGVFVGNLLGRTAWRIAEHGVMKVPLIRAIYPAVKQVTDFLLSDKSSSQFQGSKVVAVEPHQKGIWSIGLVTGGGVQHLSNATGQEMITVFVPSSPTAFSGYVLVVPKESVVELPLKVEEAMRLLVSGGVIAPDVTPLVLPTTVDPVVAAASNVEGVLLQENPI